MNKKIKRTEEINSIKKIREVSEKITFDFALFRFKSVKFKNFTNYVKDENEATEIINKLFTEFNSNVTTKDLVNKKHYHEITEYEKVTLISNILKELKIHKLEEQESYYQMGLTQGLRIMCIKISNIIYPLFLDPHHLIYPNDKYSSKDFKKFNCCIFNKRNN